MPFFKIVVRAGLSVCGGGILYYLKDCNLDSFMVSTSSHRWDTNWDLREDDQRRNSEIENGTKGAIRHLFLIRHGQYKMENTNDCERVLTTLGREQAMMTGKRLQDLGHNYTHLTVSTMTRARETATLIQRSLPEKIKVTYCSMLEEGDPVPPDPPSGSWRAEPHVYHQDGARIEAAFRKHFHRAELRQQEDSYEVFVCHSNVIRYCVCRSLQLPPEAWDRLSIHNGSITSLSIFPCGRVVVYTLSDCGHLPKNLVTVK